MNRKKQLASLLYVGLLINGVYQLWTFFAGPIPEVLALPILVVSIACMLVGVYFHGRAWGSGDRTVFGLFGKSDEK